MAAPKSAGARAVAPSIKARAVGLLARREYSRTELRGKLLGSDRSSERQEEVDAVLDDLVRLGYLSDERFAKALVQQKSGAWSRRAIDASLKASGVPGEVADEALAEGAIDDSETMMALWRKRFRAPPADDKEKARQVRFLQSRGFSLSAILKLLRNPPSPADEE